MLDDLRAAGYALRAGVVRAALRVPLPAYRRRSRSAASSSSCARRSSRGMCWARRRAAAARCATSIRSVERLQVKVDGLNDERHVLACNGRRAAAARRPARVGEYVAGVRYRAWQPPSCLHPTIPRARAAGLRHLRHAGAAARSAAAPITWPIPAAATTSTFPVNANEAEARRLARFSAIGHTPGETPEPRELPNPDRPLTLDLRLASGL